MILSNQLQQQISAKMNTIFTADGLEELEESMAQCNSFKSMLKLPLCHSSPECTMACRQIKKEHLNQVAYCLSEYLERLLRSTDYESNLNVQYHDELCISVSCINCCSMKFFNSIVCRKVCKLTDPLHYHKRLSKKVDRACQLQPL